MELNRLIRDSGAIFDFPPGILDNQEAMACAIEELVRAGRCFDREAALEAVLSREAMASTGGLLPRIAMPHGPTSAVERLTMAVGVSEEGIEWDDWAEESTRIVILLVWEINNPGPHLQCMGEWCRLLGMPGFAERALACDSESLLRLLDEVYAAEA